MKPTPKILLLALLVCITGHACAARKPAESPPPAVVESPAKPKPSLLSRLNPFKHREPKVDAKVLPAQTPPATTEKITETQKPKRSLLSRLNPWHKENPSPPPAAPEPAARSVASKGAKAKPMPASETLAQPLADPPAKRSLLSRLNPFAKRTKSSPPAPDKDKPKADPKITADAAPPQVDPQPTDEFEAKPEKRRGLLARLFGRGADGEEPEWTAEKQVRPDDWETKWVVDETSPTYSFGPSQATGSDGSLQAGTVVSLRHSGKGWSDIKTEEGKTVCIASDQIRRAERDDFIDPPPPPPVFVGPAPGGPLYYDPLPSPFLPEGSQGEDPLGSSLLPMLPPVEP